MSDKFDQAMEESVLTRESLERIETTLNRIEAILETFQDFVLEVSPALAKEQIQELEQELNQNPKTSDKE
tara:strand:+ start:522 stop:731 length:210 start_codon:yes stop_codon:yes gene_type:complete